MPKRFLVVLLMSGLGLSSAGAAFAQTPQTPTSSADQPPKLQFSVAYVGMRDNDIPAFYSVGWTASVIRNRNDRIAFVGEVGGSYKKFFGQSDNFYNFMGGGQLRFPRQSTVTPFVQTLVGVIRESASQFSANSLAVQASAGVDRAMTPKLAARVEGFWRVELLDVGGWVNQVGFRVGILR
jgi:hypothetical protein